MEAMFSKGRHQPLIETKENAASGKRVGKRKKKGERSEERAERGRAGKAMRTGVQMVEKFKRGHPCACQHISKLWIPNPQ